MRMTKDKAPCCSRTFSLEGILWRVRFRNVDNAVHVEGDLLARRAPVLISKAVEVFAVVLGVEGVIAVGGGLLEDFVLPDWVCDLTGDAWR